MEPMTTATFENLVREHHRMVYTIAASYVGASSAEDVCQDAYLRAFKGLSGLRDPARIKPWLFGITRHAALDHLRRTRRHDIAVLRWRPAKITDTQALELVWRVLDTLREDYRQILLLRYVEGLRYGEIAEALGMTVGAVGEKLSRVRAGVAEQVRTLGEIS